MVRRLSLLLVLALAGVVTILPGAAAGGFCHAEESGMTSSDKTRVAIAKCAFAQTVTYVDRGASVTWTSRDVFP
ncbi:MAG TPA: hypothetical protein VHJ76_01830, partial [Actinomycetota bacterium]|nr:hypothetical protein [Actinomycetota bacterium]